MSVKVFIILVTVAAGAILLMATVIACKVLSLVLKGVKKGRERIRRITKKQTPRGLLIADLLLAVHREDGSQLSDYIPSIMWNGTATRATEKLHVGDCIEAVGRLQSREYIKDLGDRGKEPRTCYELSVNQYELQKKKETA